ncbi:MAG: mechanosensitive ion channel family protein [Armatimonadota bacterium]
MIDIIRDIPREHYLIPIAFILGGYIAGIIIEKIVLVQLKRLAEHTKWQGDDIIIKSIKGRAVLWLSILGIYLAVDFCPMLPDVAAIFHKTLVVLFILSTTKVTASIIVGLIYLYTRKMEGILPSTTIFSNIIKIIVFVVGALIIMQYLGISITPILTAMGVGGLAVALAMQDTLSNLFSGFYIIMSKKIKPGDYVEIDTVTKGYVVDITWRETTIRALPNNIIIVPNSKLASAVIINYSLPETELSVLIDVGVSYDSDLEKVEKVTIDVAKQTLKEVEGGVASFEPFIRYHTFDDFSINFTVILRAKEFVSRYVLKHEFVKRLHERYNKEGIEIPFPIRTVHMKEKVLQKN